MLPGPPGFVDQEENLVGSYRRWFDLDPAWEGMQVYLHMGSVGSAVALWVNGQDVGYSQGSKVPTQFNVTLYLVPGRNLVAVRVWRWSDGSYLEDVDLWRLTGMERDVFLYAQPVLHLRDFFARTTLDERLTDGVLELDLTFRNLGPEAWTATAEVEVLDPHGRPVLERSAVTDMAAGEEAVLRVRGTIPEVAPWTAETPNLYTLLITTGSGAGTGELRGGTVESGAGTGESAGGTGEQETGTADSPARARISPGGGAQQFVQTFSRRIGFRTVEISDGLLKVNGTPVVLRGVNRHEHSSWTGRVMSDELMLRDIRLMKALNINAVRTSHYPNDLRWLELADERGLYLVD